MKASDTNHVLLPVPAELKADFTMTNRGALHAPCGHKIERTEGTIQISFCMTCNSFDYTSFYAFDFIFQTVKARKGRVSPGIWFDEVVSSILDNQALRVWEFYTDSSEPDYVYLGTDKQFHHVLAEQLGQ